MTAYSLSTTLPPDVKDVLIALWYAEGMTGCEEKNAGPDSAITCYFNDPSAAGAAKSDVLSRFPHKQAIVSEVVDQDWNAQWKASMKPALIAPGVWASPQWLPPSIGFGEHWIKIEPKMAFGTGHHATTRLASRSIRAAQTRLKPGYELLDIGCGSGILCFIARLYGARRAVGIDIDPVCVENLAENRDNNPPWPRGGFAAGTLDIFKSGTRFDCVIMNMISAESLPLLDRITELLGPGGLLLWSGILTEEKNDVVHHASGKGFAIQEETVEEEWWCGVFSRA